MPIATRNVRTAATVALTSSGAPDSKRRRFLFALGVGSAGIAASATAPVAAAASVTAVAPAVANDGYRETAHVRGYYRTAKL